MSENHSLLHQWIDEADAVIFDCDGTLVDTMPVHYEAWRETLDAWGCPFPEPLFYQLGGMPARRIIEKLNAEHGLAMPVDATAHAKEDRFLAISEHLQVIAETSAIARDLWGKKPIAVASGGLRRVVLHALEAAGVRELFPVIVTADEVEHGKPAPDTYLLTAERLGVDARRCVVFEDAATGIASAEAAGTRCVEVRVQVGPDGRQFQLIPRSHPTAEAAVPK